MTYPTVEADRPGASSTESPVPQPSYVRRRTRALLGVGALAAVVGSVVGVDLITNDTDTASVEFDEEIDALVLDVTNGSVTVEGTDDSTISIDVQVHGGLRKPRHSETVIGDELVVRSNCAWGPVSPTCSVDYTIRVPAGVEVTAHGDGTSYDLVTMTGDVDVSLNGGDADVSFSRAPRHVTARTSGGDISIQVPAGDDSYRVDADSDGGSVHVDVRTDLTSDRLIDAHADGGSVRIGYGNDPDPAPGVEP